MIAAAPGSALTRERFLLTFALPRLTWAAPYVPAVPVFLAASWRRALRPSSCTWWCAGRVWADSITAHPVFAAAFACLREAARPRTKTEPVVTACVRHHASTLGLSVYGVPPAFHLVLPPHDDPRLIAAFARLAAQHQADPLRYRPDWDDGHLLHVTARVRALSRIKPTRADSEEADDVDVEAQSHPAFTAWSRSLQGQEAAFLRVFRGGAIKTPTRRYWQRGAPAQLACRCGHATASARHYFSECPLFADLRRQLGREYSIPPAWWASQPRITSKSGWITCSAGSNVVIRAQRQVAACRLGIEIAKIGDHVVD